MKHDNFFLGTRSVFTRSYRLVVVLIGFFLMLQFVSLYLSWPRQLVLGGVSILLALVIHRVSRSHIVTLAMMILSLIATLRYGWWRCHAVIQYFTDESNQRVTIDAVLMLILLSAEAYTILIMILGFMQTSWPLQRKPIPLPADESQWPHVDVFIPTYNEPLSLVRYTALAAINMDYPPDKLHVYLLDDGTRATFREFAEQAGVGYITRKKHDHAKAGNINHALAKTTSEFVTIFDCDHVPTRSFLQLTVGWFLVQKKLAMLQTPHHFYSPDPFERNLQQYRTIPNEGELFYGIIQDGNDLWNATFFCGSCAVIRRTALNEVGGIAVETVTEDAHTSLRMQKHGWNTAYINVPQAAGLATETLAAHVGQRVRWARGMVQILRTDNPMLASGMKFTQRLCYFNAMLHFMYAVPRLIFLCSPLIYMLAGRSIIPGYWAAIMAYAMPHLVISSLTNSRVQGRHRHSFWNEIYETVLAPYILLPTLLALINPKLGSFNVTDKGNTLEESRYDRHTALPTTLLLLLNFVGVCVAPYRYLVTDSTHPGTVLSNLAWILFNMVILGVAAAVAHEQKQQRRSVRIPLRIPVQIHTASGREVSCISHSMSVGGALLEVDNADLTTGEAIKVSFPMQTGETRVSARIAGTPPRKLRIQFMQPDLTEQETITRALYSRANSWIDNGKHESDRPLRSFGRVLRLSFTGFNQVLRSLLPFGSREETPKKIVTAAAMLLLTLALIPLRATAQTHSTQQPDLTLYGDAADGDDGDPLTESDANFKISFKDMGVQDSIPMSGPHSFYTLSFFLEHSRIPQQAVLNMTYRFNPKLIAKTGQIKVSLNQTLVAVIEAPAQPNTGYTAVSIPLPADHLVRNNQITFECTGSASMQTEGRARELILANIGATSQVLVASDAIPLQRDLSLLPQPIFDPDLQVTSNIAFVFPARPSYVQLQAAAVMASWLGILTSTKPIHYTVSLGEIPRGNVIVFNDTQASAFPSLKVPEGKASITIDANPNDPEGNALILTGADEQLVAAAQTISLMKAPASTGDAPRMGQAIPVTATELPAPRKPDDAPRWMQTDQLTALWVPNRGPIRSDGSKPYPVYFRVPPDLDYGETQNLNLKLSYHYQPQAVAQGSEIRVDVNGKSLRTIPLDPGGIATDARTLILPVADLRPFGNTLVLNFDLNSNGQHAGDKLSADILKQSYLDLRGLDHYAAMPNLELFANAGFPFTRKADLGETVVILPVTPAASEIAMLLYLMSHCGAQTGYPALRVEIAGPGAVMRPDRDYLVLGKIANQPAFGQLEDNLPLTFDAEGIYVKPASTLSTIQSLRDHLLGSLSTRFKSPANPIDGGAPGVILEGIESPFFAGRSIVALALRDDQAVDDFAPVFFDRSQSSDIANSVSLLRNGKFSSYALPTGEYHVGDIAPWPLMRLWFAEHLWLLFGVVGLFSLALAAYAHDYLALLAAFRLEER